ncbi:hypothetical protein ACFLZG_04525 [Thermodesulfobacteriota bacterium]
MQVSLCRYILLAASLLLIQSCGTIPLIPKNKSHHTFTDSETGKEDIRHPLIKIYEENKSLLAILILLSLLSIIRIGATDKR